MMRTRRVAGTEALALWIELQAVGEKAFPLADGIGRTVPGDAPGRVGHAG